MKDIVNDTPALMPPLFSVPVDQPFGRGLPRDGLRDKLIAGRNPGPTCCISIGSTHVLLHRAAMGNGLATQAKGA
jgi:hypothetical protein